MSQAMDRPAFQLAHIGINAQTSEQSMEIAKLFADVFGFTVRQGNSSNFAGEGIEVMKKPYLGEKGHIAIGTPDVAAARAYLEDRGIQFLPETEKKKNEVLTAVYLAQEYGGFAIHLVEKKNEKI